jgi:hypothetical protein
MGLKMKRKMATVNDPNVFTMAWPIRGEQIMYQEFVWKVDGTTM